MYFLVLTYIVSICLIYLGILMCRLHKYLLASRDSLPKIKIRSLFTETCNTILFYGAQNQFCPYSDSMGFNNQEMFILVSLIKIIDFLFLIWIISICLISACIFLRGFTTVLKGQFI